MPLIAKESFQSCLPAETTQYTHLINSLSRQTSFATTYLIESQSLNWYSSTFFPLVSKDSDSSQDMIVLVYYSNNPIYVKNAGTPATSTEHYRGGWTGLQEMYDEIQSENAVLYHNASFLGIDPGTVHKLIMDFKITVPYGKSYLTFVPQRIVNELEGDSWQLSVIAAMRGFACGLYSGSAYPGYKLAGSARKYALAQKYKLNMFTFSDQAPKLAREDINDAKYVPFGSMPDPEGVHNICANDWNHLLVCQIVCLGSFRNLAAKQSVGTTERLDSVIETAKQGGDEEFDSFVRDLYEHMYPSRKAKPPGWDDVFPPGGLTAAWLGDSVESAIQTLKDREAVAQANSLHDTYKRAFASYKDFTYLVHPTLFATLIHQVAVVNGFKQPAPEHVSRDMTLTPKVIAEANERAKKHLGKPFVPPAAKKTKVAKQQLSPEAAAQRAKANNETAKNSAIEALKARFKKSMAPTRATENEDEDA